MAHMALLNDSSLRKLPSPLNPEPCQKAQAEDSGGPAVGPVGMGGGNVDRYQVILQESLVRTPRSAIALTSPVCP